MKPIIPGDFSLPFLRKEKVAKDTYSFYFDRSKNPKYTFYPGQYNRVILHHKDPDSRGSSRNFSIASSPNNKKELMITTKVVQSTFKKALLNLRPGTWVEFFGPVGRFILDDSDKTPRVLFSEGLGIAPFHGMILYAVEKKIPIPITLFASFASIHDFLYIDELTHIAKSHQNIRVVYVITTVSSSWSGEIGKVSGRMIKKYIPDISESITMTCGRTSMVDSTIAMLTDLGVAKENLMREQFVGY